MCVLEFGAQPFEPLAPLVEAVVLGGYERFALFEFGLPLLSHLQPGVAFPDEFLLAAFEFGFARLPLLGLRAFRLRTSDCSQFFDESQNVRPAVRNAAARRLPACSRSARSD